MDSKVRGETEHLTLLSWYRPAVRILRRAAQLLVEILHRTVAADMFQLMGGGM